MRLTRPVAFDPAADLAAIAALALAWRGQFRDAPLAHTPAWFRAELDRLASARAYRLYLVTRPAQPIALALIDGLSPDDAVDLMALAPGGGPDLVRPLETTPRQRRALMRQAPDEPTGHGVFAFLVGEPEGLAWLELPPEGLVLALARWGGLNVLDPAPLFAQRLARLAERLSHLGPVPGRP
jgi:hypothetical protein